MEKILVTGCAGFIGSHVSEFLLKNNKFIIGLDNLNNYYDVNIKKQNVEILSEHENFIFLQEDICDTDVISKYKPDKIIHLASMAGVRFSIENPHIYTKVNIDGFIHILEESVKNNVKHIVYASSSSVYGLNEKVPFSESDIISNVIVHMHVVKWLWNYMEEHIINYMVYQILDYGFLLFMVQEEDQIWRHINF